MHFDLGMTKELWRGSFKNGFPRKCLGTRPKFLEGCNARLPPLMQSEQQANQSQPLLETKSTSQIHRIMVQTDKKTSLSNW